ncbi:hypothetical protein H9L39_19104 [Fusarium oxysporum f. sp. albedinis]|nr:hypothetical protein H9L39_19104 [Fusarium oxysporum f. sp. albedinis]
MGLPQQLLSSSCITPNRLARQDASARRTNLSTWSPEPFKTQSPPKTAPATAVVRTLRTSSPNSPDLKADGLEYLDLTNDASESSDSLPFNSNAKLCREDYASRPNLVASSGRKRKSSETSEEEFSDLGDFPSIYELIGTYPPTARPGSRSGTGRRDGSRSNRLCGTRDGVRDHLSTEISPISGQDEDGILSPSSYVHSPLACMQSPRKVSPIIDTQPPSKGATSPSKKFVVSSEASNPVHQTNSLPSRMDDGRYKPLSPDSDEESLTPPSHNISIAILKREELTQAITQAYAQGLDTDEDEVRLDDLIDEIQAVEHVLLKTIDGTGLDVAGFLGTVQKPTHGRPPASVIVEGTRPMFQKSADLSMMLNVAPLASEMGTRVVHEAQLPNASQNLQYPATSRIEASQRTSAISQENNAVGAPLFSKDTAKPSNAPYQSRRATRPSMEEPIPVDAEFGVGDDGLSDLDEL